MNSIERAIAIILSPIFKRLPSSKTINRTGIVKSDHPIVGNGWIKGWVVNVEPKNIVIVCAHANPSVSAPNNKIFVVDKMGVKHERTIVAIDKAPFKVFEGEPKYDFDYYNSSDIAICKLNKPLPDKIQAYNFSRDLENYADRTLVFDQEWNESTAEIRYDEKIAWIRGKKRRDNQLVAGDSGMPWFVWEKGEWRVLTHTHRGQWGEGPWYAHPFIFNDLEKRIEALQK